MSEWLSASHAFQHLERADDIPHRAAGETDPIIRGGEQ